MINLSRNPGGHVILAGTMVNTTYFTAAIALHEPKDGQFIARTARGALVVLRVSEVNLSINIAE